MSLAVKTFAAISAFEPSARRRYLLAVFGISDNDGRLFRLALAAEPNMNSSALGYRNDTGGGRPNG